jgi:tetratricopeptide (TPR) repeat protein
MRPETVISFDEEQPLCKLPEHRGQFEGRLENDGQTLTVSFNEPRYNVYWSYLGSFLALGTAKSCRGVEDGSSESMVLQLTRQQSAGASTGTSASIARRDKSASDYLIRGALALEVAKSSDDLLVAEAEFKKATEIDPQLADAWYNLGLLYAKSKNYPQAVAAYQKYLAVSPSAPNAKQIEDEITKLQYFQERQPELPKPGWTFLAETTSDDRQGDKYYYDLSTIKNQNGVKSIVILWDLAKPPGGRWDWNSVKEVHEINCASKQGRLVSRAMYEERMGKGKLLYQHSKEKELFVYDGTKPGSMGQVLIDAVCR